MYIRKVTETKFGNTYESYRIVESVRIDGKPRQRVLLNLGSDFALPKEQHKVLCDLIKEKLYFADCDYLIPQETHELDSLATSLVKSIVKKHSGKNIKISNSERTHQAPFFGVDLDSLGNNDIRSIGGEILCMDMIEKLQLEKKFQEFGFTKQDSKIAISTIVARLLHPGSDLSSWEWLKESSALDELIDFDFSDLSLSRFY